LDDDPPSTERLTKAANGVFTIIGRVTVNDPEGLDRAPKFQDGLHLAQLKVREPLLITTLIRRRVSSCCSATNFGSQSRRSHPLQDTQQSYEPTGILAAELPHLGPNPKCKTDLLAAERIGTERLETLIKTVEFAVRGWVASAHTFDYNLDSFELGTVESDTWRQPSLGFAHLNRAGAARLGL
jgi:hypothetical protein